MKTLNPIGIENQLTDVLNGQNEEQEKAIAQKIAEVSEKMLTIDKVNGAKVYNPIVSAESVHYSLHPNGQRYYYPIQYATIEFREPKPTNLDMLFIDQIRNFAHLVTIEPQTKDEFLRSVKRTYSKENPKNHLFCLSVERSTFETIRMNRTGDGILFNQ